MDNTLYINLIDLINLFNSYCNNLIYNRCKFYNNIIHSESIYILY